MLRRLRLFGTLLASVALILAPVHRVFAAPAAAPSFQVEEQSVGLFGTVSAVLASTTGGESTIVMTGGDVVAVDGSTDYAVPGVESPSLDDIAVGDRLAVVAILRDDGSLLATDVLETSVAAVENVHIVGVVIAVGDGVDTLLDDDGVEHEVALPAGVVVAIGDVLTVVVSIEGGVETTSYVATIEEVIDRLLEDVALATAEEVAILEELIAETGDAQLTAVAGAIQEVAVETQEALAAVLEEASQELEALIDDAGVDIPGIKIEGFVTAVDLVEGLGTVTITPVGDEEITLVVDENTEIGEPIAVGDPVKAKYTLGLLALKVELKDALKLEGTVTGYTPDVEI